ncbi:glycosyltransferase family 2 protein [Vibrio cyclitrophicus]
MKFSIILATCNRSEIIKTTLESIIAIDMEEEFSLEVIIVDQSFDSKTYDVVMSYKENCEMIYVHALKKGLSHSRNIGLDIANGDVVCFGDDDCAYDRKVLSVVFSKLNADNLNLVCGAVIDPETGSLTKYTPSSVQHFLTRKNFYIDITSISIFISKAFIDQHNIRFDEKFGLGALFSSCEEVDFVRRCLESNARGVYFPEIKVYHENQTSYSAEKTELYARGHGAYCRKLLLSEFSIINYHYVVIKMVKILAKFPFSLIRIGIHPKFYLKGYVSGFQEFKND